MVEIILSSFVSSLIAVLIPGIILTSILWKLDIYNLKPFRLFIIHLIYGIFCALILSVLFRLIIDLNFLSKLIQNEFDLFLFWVFYGPLFEEIAKGIFLIYSSNWRENYSLTDGIIYGALIGLGFSLIENFFYFYNFKGKIFELIGVIFLRNTFTIPMHIISTSVLGLILFTVANKKLIKKLFYYLLGIITATIIHAFWNVIDYSSHNLYYIIAYLAFLIIVYTLTVFFSFKHEQKILLNELLDESLNGELKFDYAFIIPYYKKRNSLKILKNHIGNEIIKTATKLAFRKHQLKKTDKENLIMFYLNDVQFLRNKLKFLELYLNE